MQAQLQAAASGWPAAGAAQQQAASSYSHMNGMSWPYNPLYGNGLQWPGFSGYGSEHAYSPELQAHKCPISLVQHPSPGHDKVAR